jgi:hypothetical protein
MSVGTTVKANELRIGNLVQANNVKYRIGDLGKISCIVAIDSDKKYNDQQGTATLYLTEDNNKDTYGQWLDYLAPIPITEEWLLMFGFKKELLSDDSGYYYSLDFIENKHCDLSICSGDKNGFIEVTLFPYEDWFRYKYVHQLQNLYFALIGEELSVRLENNFKEISHQPDKEPKT